jgi:predicted nucleic acid-binding protein
VHLCNGLVVDTSIWINFLATGRIWEIVGALDVPCSTPEQVLKEVLRDPVSAMVFPTDQHPLRNRPELEIVSLDGQSLEVFFELISGSAAQRLGDGEAAAIALASTRGWTIAVDERKARRLVRERFPSLSIIMSIELLSLPSVTATLGADQARAALADAIKFGRMHIPHDWVSSNPAVA